jgi:cytochrome c peroxidase
MRQGGIRWIASVLVVAGSLGGGAAAARDTGLSPIEALGERLFRDPALSVNGNQSCASCHAASVGWTGPDAAVDATGAVYQGSVPGRFGNRKPPAAAYAGAAPVLHQLPDGTWVGGTFWDGRATGWTLGDPLAEQAQGPFLNPLEQGLPDAAQVVARVCASEHAQLFERVWGRGACRAGASVAFEWIARSIAAYERSPAVSAFSSRYDRWLARRAALTPEQRRGLELFEGKGRCAGCHVSAAGGADPRPLFTDYTFDNLGIPRNPLNPFYYEPSFNPAGAGWIDEGLGGFLRAAGFPYERELGKFQVPTLRNVDLRPSGLAVGEPIKAYGHNGYFKSLEEVVHFYNTRDVLPVCAAGAPGERVTCWPAPEYPATVNTTEVGNLGLTPAEERAIVAFLRALSDAGGR